jgi:ABC-type Fe3+-hydroxamate transport system substrate-binding protein
MMREIRLNKTPSRIVSLVPSITELLVDLGLNEEIAGITKFCIHPDIIFKSKKHIGGTKKINHHIIAQINPDLIIANKEENTKADIELLKKKYPVWISDINTLQDALGMIRSIGEITGKLLESERLIGLIKRQFELILPIPPTRSLYLIWRKPFMAAGKNTFINEMMKRCGFINVLDDKSRYPILDATIIKELNPALIFLSSEPYPFKEKHVSELKEILPESKIELVDGEYFSWYGSRIGASPDYFNKLIERLNNWNPAPSLYEN